MERKFVLLIKTEDSKFCWKGERTQKQIEKDLEKLTDIDAEILPVIGNKSPRYLGLALSGIFLIGLGTLIYRKTHENIRKRCKRR